MLFDIAPDTLTVTGYKGTHQQANDLFKALNLLQETFGIEVTSHAGNTDKSQLVVVFQPEIPAERADEAWDLVADLNTRFG